MNILVCVKYVPDTDVVYMNEQNSLVRSAYGQKLNPADESALEAALQLAGGEGQVTVLTMGASFCAAPLNGLIARGATKAVLLTDKVLAGSDSFATVRALAAAINTLGSFDLIICGRRALDGETGQVPAGLAARLDLPCATNLIKIMSPVDQTLRCVRLLEDGEHTLCVQLPAVVSLCEYTHSLRLPSLVGLKKAKHTPVRILGAAGIGLSKTDCGLDGSPTRVKKITPQQAGRRRIQMLIPGQGATVLSQLIIKTRKDTL